MDQDSSGLVPRKGMTIVGSDGKTVGEIDVVERSYVIVRKGGIFPQDHFIAVRDIVAQDEHGALRLSIPADEALERGLGNPMVGAQSEHTATMDAAAHAGIDVDTSLDEPVDIDVVPDLPEPAPLQADVDDADVDVAGIPEPQPRHEEIRHPEFDADDQQVRDDRHRTVTLSEEEVTATTRPVERGVVRVEKKVIEERQTIEVPLVEDEVHVTRRRVDREITDDDAPFEDAHIEIPLRGQGVEIEKRAHVVEEIDIDTTAHEYIEEIRETVRRERARVETDAVNGAPGSEETDGRVT